MNENEEKIVIGSEGINPSETEGQDTITLNKPSYVVSATSMTIPSDFYAPFNVTGTKPENMSLRELLDAETACDLLMKYYKIEGYGLINETHAREYVDTARRKEYDETAKKYHSISKIREKIIKEIENRISGLYED